MIRCDVEFAAEDVVGDRDLIIKVRSAVAPCTRLWTPWADPRPGHVVKPAPGVRLADGPGFIEADTVAYCGEPMAEEFCGSLTMTDVHTQWTETRPMANRGQHVVQGAIAEVEAMLPFAILGFDTDNIRECLKLLHANGNQGTLSIECEGQSGPMPETSLNWLRKTLKELGIPEKF